MSGIKIALLGGCHITWDGKPVTGVQTPRLQALLAYLLLHRNSPISRQQLAFQFWPESSEGQARTNLRHLVHSLRSALPQGQNFLLGDGQEIAWNRQETFSLDVEDFERSLAEAGSALALRIYAHQEALDWAAACADAGPQVARRGAASRALDSHLRNSGGRTQNPGPAPGGHSSLLAGTASAGRSRTFGARSIIPQAGRCLDLRLAL